MSKSLFQRTFWQPGAPSIAVARWGARDAAIGLGLAVLVAGVLGLAISPLSLVFDSDNPNYLFLNSMATLAFELGLLLIVFRLTIYRGAEPVDLGVSARGWRLSASGVGLLASYAALYSYLVIVNALGMPGLEPAGQLPSAVFDHPTVLFVLGLSVVFVAPFTEELFFRGFVFRGLSNSFGVWPAALSSGFIFSLAHLNIGAIVPFTIIGVIFAISYQRTGSLWTPIVTHFVFNLVSFSILVLVPEARN